VILDADTLVLQQNFRLGYCGDPILLHVARAIAAEPNTTATSLPQRFMSPPMTTLDATESANTWKCGGL
jgi:hypothetical protein